MLTTNQTLKNEVPIACDLTAIPAEQREQHQATAEQIFGAVRETRELPNGYAFRLEPDMWLKAAEFIANERLCCPFFSFTLELEPGGGPLWLKLAGGEGVKQFIQAEVLPSSFYATKI
jgi:hypothetical protein